MLLGFDFGMKYIGVATGQTITKSATPLTCLKATDGIPNWDEIAKLIITWEPEALVVGIPHDMENTHITAAAQKFANRLQHKYHLPVHTVDERLTTWEAKQRQEERDFEKLNAMAAAVILEVWLNMS